MKRTRILVITIEKQNYSYDDNSTKKNHSTTTKHYLTDS